MLRKTCTIVFLSILIITGTLTNPTHAHSLSDDPEDIPVYKTNEAFWVGYWGYKIFDYEWMDRVGDGFYSNKRANAKFLRVNLACVNGDTSPSTLPPFKLVDDEGKEYEQTHDTPYGSRYFGILERLNPEVVKDGYILFDVPQKDYWLEISGGYLSNRKARLRIKCPKTK